MLKELAERVRSIDINQILDEVLKGEKEYILSLIRKQLIKGEKADGNAFGFYSGSDISVDYVQFKTDRGLFPVDTNGAYNFLFEGRFFDSISITIQKDALNVLSSDPKVPLMEKNIKPLRINSSDILELSQENLDLLNRRIEPLMQLKINSRLGIPFNTK